MRPDFQLYLADNYATIKGIEPWKLTDSRAKVIVRTEDFNIANDLYHHVTKKHIESFPNYRHFTRHFQERELKELITNAKIVVTNNQKVVELTARLRATILIDFHQATTSKELIVTVTNYPKG